MGRGILRGAGGDENLKSNFIWPYIHVLSISSIPPLNFMYFCDFHKFSDIRNKFERFLCKNHIRCLIKIHEKCLKLHISLQQNYSTENSSWIKLFTLKITCLYANFIAMIKKICEKLISWSKYTRDIIMWIPTSVVHIFFWQKHIS